jgi:hypothetical protein
MYLTMVLIRTKHKVQQTEFMKYEWLTQFLHSNLQRICFRHICIQRFISFRNLDVWTWKISEAELLQYISTEG